MSKSLSTIALIASGLSSFALLFGIGTLFAFQGEGLRGAKVPEIQSRLQLLALILAVSPTILTSILIVRWVFFSKAPSPGLSLMPLALGLVGGFFSYRLFIAGDQLGAPGRKKIWSEEASKKASDLDDLKQRVANGQASACELLANDPKANHEDFMKCRTLITSLPNPEDRNRESGHILSSKFHNTIILARQNGNDLLTHEDELWFLRTAYQDYLSTATKIDDQDSLNRLLTLVQSLRQQWSNASAAVIVKEFFPLIEKRLKNEAKWTDETFKPVHRTFFSSKRDRFNLLAKVIDNAKRQSDITRFLDHVTSVTRTKLESRGFTWTRNSYGHDTSDVFSEFKSKNGGHLKVVIWYWYPDDDEGANPASEPMLAAEWTLGESRWSSNHDSNWENAKTDDPRPGLQFRFTSSQSEIDRAANNLLDVIDRHILNNNGKSGKL